METPPRAYCLFCLSGRENDVVSRLQRQGYRAMSPYVLHWHAENGRLVKRQDRLLPGYVFFEMDFEGEPDWAPVLAIPSVVRALSYGDGSRTLRGADAEFLAWLHKCGGTIDITRVVEEGSRIVFVSGPLKDLGGRVAKVNKNRKCVAVDIGDGKMIKRIWCSIEYIERAEDG